MHTPLRCAHACKEYSGGHQETTVPGCAQDDMHCRCQPPRLKTSPHSIPTVYGHPCASEHINGCDAPWATNSMASAHMQSTDSIAGALHNTIYTVPPSGASCWQNPASIHSLHTCRQWHKTLSYFHHADCADHLVHIELSLLPGQVLVSQLDEWPMQKPYGACMHAWARAHMGTQQKCRCTAKLQLSCLP
jgi:hypothetical protein